MRMVDKTKEEISGKMKTMGDYVKMGYLKDCLKNSLDIETRRFVLSNLAGIYEKRKMFSESAKIYRNLSELNLNKNSKVNDLLKSLQLFMKAGMIDEADMSYMKALSAATEQEKQRVTEGVKSFYRAQAAANHSQGKRRHALVIYEKILKDFPLDLQEKRFVKEQLLDLYKKLGKVREYLDLNKKL